MNNKMSDERRAAIAIFLSILVVFTWTNLFQSPPPVAPKEIKSANSKEMRDAGAVSEQLIPAPQQASTDSNSILRPPSGQAISDEAYLEADRITIESALYRAQFSLLGARLISFQLKNYRQDAKREDLIEMVKSKGSNLPLAVTSGSLTDSASLFLLEGVSDGFKANQRKFILDADQELSFRLTGNLANGVKISKSFKFQGNSYVFDMNTEVGEASADGSPVSVSWTASLPKAFFAERYNQKSFFYRQESGGFDREYLAGDALKSDASSDVTGMGDNYFMAAFIAPDNRRSISHEVQSNIDQGVLLRLGIMGGAQENKIKVYVGPKDPQVLESVGYDLYKAIDMGWFGFVGQPLLKLIQGCFILLGNYGLAIILVTILIKIILLPLTKKSFLSMQAMQKIQPQVVALRERIKDPGVLQQEMLKIYQQNGVNPLGGCLPMLLQIPVFLGMYNALQSSIYLRHADFALWINDLSTPEQLMVFGIPVPVMILLMGGSMFLQMLTTPTTADPNQKKIMYFMPIMFTGMFIIYPFPSGLVLYWLVNNIMSIIQQYALRTERNIQPFPATLVAGVIVFGIGFILTLI